MNHHNFIVNKDNALLLQMETQVARMGSDRITAHGV